MVAQSQQLGTFNATAAGTRGWGNPWHKKGTEGNIKDSGHHPTGLCYHPGELLLVWSISLAVKPTASCKVGLNSDKEGLSPEMPGAVVSKGGRSQGF